MRLILSSRGPSVPPQDTIIIITDSTAAGSTTRIPYFTSDRSPIDTGYCPDTKLMVRAATEVTRK